jgi:acyl-coenzyme A thioesterase PaaI-like protein
LNGRVIPLDYNRLAIDEMTRLRQPPSSEGGLRRSRGFAGLVVLVRRSFSEGGPETGNAKEKHLMIDKAAGKLKSDGWKIVDSSGFLQLIGPLWQRLVNGENEFALITEDKHHNRRGLVQGGVLMTFADRTCGIAARFVSGKPMLATVQLDVHFVEAGKIGEILVSKPRVIRSTRSLIFTTTEVTVDKRCIAMANGVFKILKSE